MAQLLPSITAVFTKGLAAHLAARLNEREAGTHKVLHEAVALVLAGLISKAASREAAWLQELSAAGFRDANGTFGSLTGMLGVFGSAHDLKHGENLVATLFGEATAGLTAQLAESGDIRPASAAQLLGLAGAVLPALLGQWAAPRRLGVVGFSAELVALRRPVRALLSPALRALIVAPAAGQRTSGAGPASRRWASETVLRLTFAATAATPRLYRMQLAVVTFALLVAVYVGVGPFSFGTNAGRAQTAAVAPSMEDIGAVGVARVAVDVLRWTVPGQ